MTGLMQPPAVGLGRYERAPTYKKAPAGGSVAVQDNAVMGIGIGAPDSIGNRLGTRASANTSGPDFNRGLGPCEIADLKIRTERRKPVSSAGPVF
jgi:hypothetical protein